MRERVEAAVAELRPSIRSHGGDVSVVSVDDGVVTVRLSGACVGCPSASMTLRQGVEVYLREKVPEIRAVRAADGHTALPPGAATVELREDHRRAIEALAALEVAIGDLREDEPVPASARATIDLVAEMIARELPVHFRREDDVLFPALELPRDMGPLAQMAYEHRVLDTICGAAYPHTRARLLATERPPADAIRGFQRVAADLCYALREHIAKEDHVVFPLADRSLNADAAAALAERMREIREARWAAAPPAEAPLAVEPAPRLRPQGVGLGAAPGA